MKSIEKFTIDKVLKMIFCLIYALSSIGLFTWLVFNPEAEPSELKYFILFCAFAGFYAMFSVSKITYKKYLEGRIIFYERTKEDFQKEIKSKENGIKNCDNAIEETKKQLLKYEDYAK